MPNYRYNMPDYGRRNNFGAGNFGNNSGCPQNAGQRQQGWNPAGTQGNMPGNYCAVPQENWQNPGEISCAVEDSCDPLAGMALAMAYVPWQTWENVYDAKKGLCRGTIFEGLDKPFLGMGGVH